MFSSSVRRISASPSMTWIWDAGAGSTSASAFTCLSRAWRFRAAAAMRSLPAAVSLRFVFCSGAALAPGVFVPGAFAIFFMSQSTIPAAKL
jgi:hypothetical protein